VGKKEEFVTYTDEYKQLIKTSWYAAGKPNDAKSWLDATPEDNLGRKPHIETLRKWRRNELWDLWADDLDVKAMTLVEDSLVLEKVEMLKRHAKDAMDLQAMAMDYLRGNEFDTASSAVSAMIRGAELERTSRGIGDLILKMAKMDDTALTSEIMTLIQRASENDQIIDADPAENTTEED